MEEVLDHNQEAEQIFRQYGRLLELVAAAQLPGRPEDAEECVGDTWLRAWEAMPPSRPGRLDTFLGKITRNLSLDRWRAGE